MNFVPKKDEIVGTVNAFLAPRTLFILSHMRSNSTLISHFLGSHPDIAGYRELHLSYRSWSDIMRMRYRLRAEASHAKPIFLLDKILHNNLYVSPTHLRSKNAWFLITLRQPERTIKSIVAMATKNGNARYDTLEKSAAYYSARLKCLVDMAEHIPRGQALFLPSDAIVSDTERTLSKLQAWLDLSAPLSSEYRIFEHTGKRFGGDPSKNIGAGRVIQTNAHAYDNITVPANILADLIDQHERACEVLAARCRGRGV